MMRAIMHIQKEIVTPAMATSWLEANTNNRPLSDGRVTNLANAIRRGEWMLNGDTIRFSESGVLLDGQHRLAAIRDAGISVETFVVRGLPEKTFTTIDTGSSRTAADMLSLSGVKNSSIAASAARAYLLWKNSGSPAMSPRRVAPTPTQITEFTLGNELLAEAAGFAVSRSRLKDIMPASLAAFLYMAGAERDKEKTVEFLEQVVSPTGPRSPVAELLRDRMIFNRGSRKKMSRYEVFAIGMKALRIYINGEDVKRLHAPRKGSDNAEVFFV